MENEQCVDPAQTVGVFHACIECGEKVDSKNLVDHLEKSHKSDCIPYGCEECGYQNAEQVIFDFACIHSKCELFPVGLVICSISHSFFHASLLFSRQELF